MGELTISESARPVGAIWFGHEMAIEQVENFAHLRELVMIADGLRTPRQQWVVDHLVLWREKLPGTFPGFDAGQGAEQLRAVGVPELAPDAPAYLRAIERVLWDAVASAKTTFYQRRALKLIGGYGTRFGQVSFAEAARLMGVTEESVRHAFFICVRAYAGEGSDLQPLLRWGISAPPDGTAVLQLAA